MKVPFSNQDEDLKQVLWAYRNWSLYITGWSLWQVFWNHQSTTLPLPKYGSSVIQQYDTVYSVKLLIRQKWFSSYSKVPLRIEINQVSALYIPADPFWSIGPFTVGEFSPSSYLSSTSGRMPLAIGICISSPCLVALASCMTNWPVEIWPMDHTIAMFLKSFRR